MSPITHILVPVGFDQTSAHALDYALSLAKLTGAKVTALHVFGLAVLNALDAEYIPTASAGVACSPRRRSSSSTRWSKPRKDREASRSVGELRVGSAAEEIVSRAKELGVDLIVVGKHTRGMLERALVGSVATQVIRTPTSPCSPCARPEDLPEPT
jgi:nucleotide-binding universal stress UspA family protein